MKKFFSSYAVIISIAVVAILFMAFPAFAAIVSGDLKNPPNSLNSFLKLGINVANYILGIVGALTLLMFVYGGVMMIISGGSADKVKKGKDIIIGSVVGLMIVFGSYLIVSFVSKTMLDVEFNGSLPEEQKAVDQKPGTLCEQKDGGYCASSTASCAQGETSDQVDCEKDKKCCYKKVQSTCEAVFGGQCSPNLNNCVAIPNATNSCPLGGDICCEPKAPSQTVCGQPLGNCRSLGTCLQCSGDILDFTCPSGMQPPQFCCSC